MIHLSSACPLRIAQVRWQPRPDLFAVTVVCKATFALRPVESPLASAQEKPLAADLFWDDDPRASLRAATDLVPFKRRVDVLVVGHAHAPHGQPVTSLIARVAVGGVDKSVEVHGDRRWTPEGQLTTGAPFTRMPLRWERAACGPSAWNPVGVSPGGLVPNLQPAGMVLHGPADAVPPIGLGSIAPRWPERVARLHRHAATFRHEAWSERPLPDDIDAAYFNAAPPDQQLAELAPGERLLLENLHPEHPQLITVLEEVIPRAVAQRPGGEAQEIRLRCDTLCIDADQGTCTLVWRGALVLRSADEDVVVIVTASQRDAEEDAEAATLVPRGRSGDAVDVTVTQAPGRVQGEPGEAIEVEEVERTLPPALIAANAGLPFAAPALPFAPPGEASPAAPAEARTSGIGPTAAPTSPGDGTGTIAAGLVPAAPQPLPFEHAAAQPSPPPPAPPQAPPTMPAPPEAHVWVALPPPPPLMAPLNPAPVEAQRRPTPLPPPLLGTAAPAATAERLSGQDTQGEPPTARIPSEPAAAATPAPPAPPAPNVPSAHPEPEVRPEDVPLDRHAAIAAEIAEARASRAEVLRAHGLTEGTWSAVDRHWRAALDKDARAGARLRAAHDAAYVAAVERLRGPIALSEYARIAVALERGEANEALDALKIQRPALMPIVRVWTKKVAADAKLAAEAIALLSRLRAAE